MENGPDPKMARDRRSDPPGRGEPARVIRASTGSWSVFAVRDRIGQLLLATPREPPIMTRCVGDRHAQRVILRDGGGLCARPTEATMVTRTERDGRVESVT